MVLCLKTINLRPTQEKTKKIAMVLCLKAINLRPTQEKIKKTTILGGSGHEIKGVADHFGIPGMDPGAKRLFSGAQRPQGPLGAVAKRLF